jgi:hypothetical protein
MGLIERRMIMTVKELIEFLKTQPEDAIILSDSYNTYEYSDGDNSENEGDNVIASQHTVFISNYPNLGGEWKPAVYIRHEK